MTVAFAFLAGMTLVSALGVVLSRSVVHSALFMSGSFLGISGFFVMLNAPALAAFQILIYVGAVTVVILFGIMFTQKPLARRYRTIINLYLVEEFSHQEIAEKLGITANTSRSQCARARQALTKILKTKITSFETKKA